DRIRPVGRIDFSAAASGPFDLAGQDPIAAIKHEIIAYPRGFGFQLKNFARRLEAIQGGEARLVNGMITFQELSGRYGDDLLRLRGARLPLAGLPKIEYWQEISGVITFNPPLRHYTPKIDKVLDILNPSGPFLVAGNYTYDRNPGATTRRSYDLIVSSDNGVMTLAPRKIVFSKIRGDATVTPDGVEVHAAQADLLGGKIQTSGIWKDTDEVTHAYQGQAVIRDLDLAKLEEQL